MRPEAPRRARILVVDDEAGLLRVAERILATRHEVRSIAMPRSALDLAREFKPDLAICDVRMPEMDGFMLADALRKEHPGLDIIFMTGSNAELSAHFVRAIRERAFYFVQKPFEREVLETLVDRCLELRRLRDADRRHVSRLERELEEARTFQESMLAPEQAVVEGVAIRASCSPCVELGGDLYDFVSVGSGKLAFVVADVRGHGASAAFLTATVKAAFRGGSLHGFRPSRTADGLADSMRALPPDRFVTAFIGLLDSADGRLEYVSAGHPPGLVIHGGDAVPLESTGPLICSAFERGSWPSAETRLRSGSRLLVYTDGLTDAPGPAGRYGTKRLRERLGGAPGTLDGLVRMLLDEVRAFSAGLPQEDDITLLALERS